MDLALQGEDEGLGEFFPQSTFTEAENYACRGKKVRSELTGFSEVLSTLISGGRPKEK